jgi:glycosyltransferase involved in cell wall biosynthesis
MRIAICTTQVPFVSGGAELHAQNLAEALRQHGHQAEIISLPFKWYPADEIVRNMLAWQLLDLTESNGTTIDLVIGLKFPAYLVNHPNKVIWILHQHRQAYELWNSPFADLRREVDGPRVRDIIVDADNRFIREARRVFANSQTVADRLKRFNNINATPLYHPPPNTPLLACKAYGDFIFCPSRLDATKRQSLLIEAMSHTDNGVKCVIAGAGPLEHDLRTQISALGLRDRVILVGRVTDRPLADY